MKGKYKLFIFAICLFFAFPAGSPGVSASSEMKVHFIDVGEGDAILIQSGGHNMMVDFGDSSHAASLEKYLKKHGVTSLDYAICTHPHSDHMAGMPRILSAFKADKVFLSRHYVTRKYYKKVLKICKEKNYPVIYPKRGEEYKLGEAKFRVLSIGDSDPNVNWNEHSIVIRLVYGKKSFLLMGDACFTAEKELMKGKYQFKSDVIKIAHHAAKVSSSKKFLKKTKAKYAIVTTGANNKYAHPSTGTLKRIKLLKMKLYRTDAQGTITAVCNGKKIKWNKQPTKNYKGRSR